MARGPGLDPHQPCDQPHGRVRKQNGVGERCLLQACREMRRLPYRRVIHMQVIADGAHHDFPRVETDATLYGQAVGTAHLVGIGAECRLHGEGGVTGPCRVILMGTGGAKEGHNAVAQHLVHRAFIAVHRVHHGMQGGIQELLGRLGVEIANQGHGVLDIRKEHRDLLALAGQGGARRAGICSARAVGVSARGARWADAAGGWGASGGGAAVTGARKR